MLVYFQFPGIQIRSIYLNVFHCSVCFEGDVRLVNTTFGSVNGMTSVYGVVQVCINQQFGYVCSEGWDDREAEVACRTYNYNYRPPFYGK